MKLLYKKETVTELRTVNGWILFFTSCGHAHTRPPNWPIKVCDTMICPVCYPDYPNGNRRLREDST
jgi:hypothetical protein